jgi:DNA repair ATPase RecN
MARVLQDLAERLTTTSESLAGSLLEAPKAADFEPLAEHLYEFARNAPRLLEALQEVPKAATPIEASVRALHEISETLEFTREKLGESLLRLPRAEDYEPLARPLREFAKVSPALAESLAAVLGVVAPLGDSVHTLKEIAAELEGSQAAVAEALTRQASPPPRDQRGALDERTREILREVAETLRDVRQSIDGALASLPSDPAYGRLAAHLRELATVSPSLMEWLAEVPTLTRPLGESVDSLEEAAARLAAARERIVGLVD